VKSKLPKRPEATFLLRVSEEQNTKALREGREKLALGVLRR